jgi:hypothetical protein
MRFVSGRLYHLISPLFCLLLGAIRIAAMDAQLNQVAAWLIKG